MYHTFYNFAHAPFASTPDPALFFANASATTALQKIVAGIEEGRRCVTLLGEAGLGKTLLLRVALERLASQQLTTLSVVYAHMTFQNVLNILAQALGCQATEAAEVTLPSLLPALVAAQRQGRRMVMVIDEAHQIPLATLEQIVQLLRLPTLARKPMIQIVFAGLPEFTQVVRGLHPVSRHYVPGLAVTLTELSQQESLEYIQHRLRCAAASGESIWSMSTARNIARLGHGNPSLLNTLCTNVLIAGAMAQQKRISSAVAHTALAPYTGQPAPWQRVAVYAASVLLVVGLWAGAQYFY